MAAVRRVAVNHQLMKWLPVWLVTIKYRFFFESFEKRQTAKEEGSVGGIQLEACWAIS